ncbi:MAG: type II toxin-antitoxin system HipA family toxin [Bacteriovorax sp.]|nr:type II toxin-antitoxin system HipA family toxin [Bacteriovorax sp.]
MSKVSVFYKNIKAGVLEKTSDEYFLFRYEEEYLNSTNPPISMTLPKTEKSFKSDSLFSFFDGLIPEGWLLNLASTELRLNPLRDRFELLTKLCHDTIGAVHIGEKNLEEKITKINNSMSASKKDETKKYGKCLICYEKADEIYHDECMSKVFEKKITPIVDMDNRLLEKLAKSQLNAKLTIAGVQKKLSLDLIDEKGKMARMTFTDLWGRFIFKPKGEPPHLPENEHLCLKLAEVAKIQVEKGALIPTSTGELGFIAVRFDRDAHYNEYHQEDFCQILDKETFKKYNGSLEQVGKILKQKSDFPGDNLYRLYEMTLFNFIIGNVDAHLKNISLIYENKSGMKTLLSPAYDLISTDLYIIDDNEETALAINGKKNKLRGSDFLALAAHFGISSAVHEKIISHFQNLVPIWDIVIDKSFIEENKKKEFKKIIRRKLDRFNL